MKSNKRKFWQIMLTWLAVLVVVAVIVLQFYVTTRVQGESMEPTLHQEDLLVISKMAYRVSTPQRGDIIVFRSGLREDGGKGEEELLIKRVVGLPGETVEIRGGRVFVDGRESDPAMTKDLTTNGNMKILVPKGRYFCLGDNRLHSMDSRDEAIGCVPAEHITGRVTFQLLPISKFGRIQRVVS